MKIYAIKDTVAGVFNLPFYQKNNAVAIRALTQAVNSNENNEIKQNVGDLQLYCLGELNQETGDITANIEFIINLVDLKQGE